MTKHLVNIDGVSSSLLGCSRGGGKRPQTKKWFSPEVITAMLVHRTKEKKVFQEFDSIIMQNMSHNLLLFCVSTWPSYPVTENHLYTRRVYRHQEIESEHQLSNGSLIYRIIFSLHLVSFYMNIGTQYQMIPIFP